MKRHGLHRAIISLLLFLIFSPIAKASTLEDEIVVVSCKESKDRLQKLRGSPYSVIAFCEDALGNYLAIIYYEKMASPVDGVLYKNSPTRKATMNVGLAEKRRYISVQNS